MNILIAEDDRVSRRLLESMLTKWGYGVIAAGDGDEAWRHLEEPDAPNLAILDWMMPGANGVEVCRRVRAQGGDQYTYVLLLTAKGGKEDIIHGMEAGADDYLVKPFDPHELKVRLRAGRRILELHAALIAAREQLREKADHDPLTGLLNRAAICEVLNHELARTFREGRPMCVTMGDLDHFKSVNDRYGHLAGDIVLREAAQRFQECSRPYDAVGRYGGEEFLFVIPGCDTEEGAALAERVREEIAAEPVDTSGGMISMTISLGVASTQGIGKANEQTLIQAADEALYRAKDGGRNRVEVASRSEVAA